MTDHLAPTMESMSHHQLVRVEKTLTTALVAWSVTSVSLGVPLALIGRKMDSAPVSQFGRQNAAWGAVDATIVGVGLIARRKRGVLSDDQAKHEIRKLRNVLAINALADVGYIAGGIAIAARSRRGVSPLRMGAGDGAAIVVQGAFLLVLDVSQAVRLRKIRQVVIDDSD
jgi:hypothetical protein